MQRLGLFVSGLMLESPASSTPGIRLAGVVNVALHGELLVYGAVYISLYHS